MNHHAGVANHPGTLLPPMPARTPVEIVRAWESPPKKLSLMDSLTAGAFLVFYLAAFLTAGFAGMNFIEWAWMRVFG